MVLNSTKLVKFNNPADKAEKQKPVLIVQLAEQAQERLQPRPEGSERKDAQS